MFDVIRFADALRLVWRRCAGQNISSYNLVVTVLCIRMYNAHTHWLILVRFSRPSSLVTSIVSRLNFSKKESFSLEHRFVLISNKGKR